MLILEMLWCIFTVWFQSASLLHRTSSGVSSGLDHFHIALFTEHFWKHQTAVPKAELPVPGATVLGGSWISLLLEYFVVAQWDSLMQNSYQPELTSPPRHLLMSWAVLFWGGPVLSKDDVPISFVGIFSTRCHLPNGFLLSVYRKPGLME